MECPGSVRLLKRLELPDTEEPDYRAEGTAAHAALEKCLREKLDAWEVVGQKFGAIECGVEMADAIQTFLDVVRPSLARAEAVYIERGIDNPDFHPLFYGTVDLGVLFKAELRDNREGYGDLIDVFYDLDINDFKYGQGIIVEVWHNKQVMYYAYGLIMQLSPAVRASLKVRLRIIQPRGFHPDGPVREWEVDAQTIIDWAEGTLRPAMLRTETDDTLNPGPHCRFCPAKLVCAAQTGIFRAMASADPKEVPDLDDEALDAQYPLIAAVEGYIRAYEAECFRRANQGLTFATFKLVHKKANRVWKSGAPVLLKDKFGDKAYTEPEVRSPAEIEKLGGLAKDFVREYAYTPESGLTVASTDDKRVGVKVRSAADSFAAFIGDKP